MERITKLDGTFSPLFEEIVKVASEIDMPFVCDLCDEEKIAKQSFRGIYRIDISTAGSAFNVSEWIERFRIEWEHDDFKKKFTPNLKKKRIAFHTVLPEWMPLYLGKSKNISGRVLEHINLPLEKTTFALKLNARPEMKKYRLRLHALPVLVQNYDLIVPTLESALRNRFNPLIGVLRGSGLNTVRLRKIGQIRKALPRRQRHRLEKFRREVRLCARPLGSVVAGKR
jgi:hypothetical protein